MLIKGTDVTKILRIMYDVDAFDVIANAELSNSDNESFVTLEPTEIDVLQAAALSEPETLLDISPIARSVFAALKGYSEDVKKIGRAGILINALNLNFNGKNKYFDLLLRSLIDKSAILVAINTVNDVLKNLQMPFFENITNIKNLLTIINTHKLYLEIQQWQIAWHNMRDCDSDDESLQQTLLQNREALFIRCDDLLSNAPQEFKKMLAHKDFPAEFLLSYLNTNYQRELSIFKFCPKILIKRLVSSVCTLLDDDSSYYTETREMLNKIGMMFETNDTKAWDISETRKILMPLVIKLIKMYAMDSISLDTAHIRNNIMNLLPSLQDINYSDTNDDTALHAAIPQRPGKVKVDLIKWLLSKGARIDSVNKLGETPLSLAARYISNEDAIISEMLHSQLVSADILELALYELISNHDLTKTLSSSKTFEILAKELEILADWSALEFFKKYSFSFDHSKPFGIDESRQTIRAVTKLVEAMQLFSVPFENIIKKAITVTNPDIPAIVGALLANRTVCELAKDSDANNVFEYIKDDPQLCRYLNANMTQVSVMLQNINPEKPENSTSSYYDQYFAKSQDILNICRIDNNVSAEYLLFTLRLLVEHVFYTQAIPVFALGMFSRHSFWNIQEQVKQQLKSAVFAMIDKGVDIGPIKAYLTEEDSGLNQLLFKSFVHNFLNEIQEREIKFREDRLVNNNFLAANSSAGVLNIDYEADTEEESTKVSSFSSRCKAVAQ
jgi:hypothetical protein